MRRGGAIGTRFALVHELGERVIHQAALLFEVAARDRLAFRMRPQPALTVTQKFLHLVIPNPIMLVVVQHRHEHVKMRQKLSQRHPRVQLDSEIRAFSPVGKLLIKWQPVRGHFVAERRKKLAQKLFATSARQRGKGCAQRKWRVHELGSLFALARHRAAEHLGNRHAQK